MQVSASTGLFNLKGVTSKRSKALDTDSAKEDHYRNDINLIEKDYHYSGGESSRCQKTKRDDQSWRKDLQERRSTGWDSEWGPSSSCET
eukprot:3966101-Amphidinium_carterae.1